MMEAPIHAFLMIRSSDGTWTVTVCRDLGAIMRKWELRDEPDRDAAVLHVGFYRPASRTFDEIAQAHPGRILLTTAAKHVVPASFISSVAPVGVAGTIELFIGLQGWGYTIEDPTEKTGDGKPSYPNATTYEPQGWVRSFLSEHPSDAGALSAHGIFNETSYLDRESQLERDIRHRAGLFRLHHIVGTNCDDPCKIAQAAPPWLASQKLNSMELTVRAHNVFLIHAINTVYDLAAWSPKALLDQRNFGRKSLDDTVQALTSALDAGPLLTTVEAVRKSDHLLSEFRRSLLKLPQRHHAILVRRLGFEISPETLQSVADQYGLSRERVRQIESNAIRKSIRKSSWNTILEQKISQLFIGRKFPLPITGLEAIDPWFKGMSAHREFFIKLVHIVCHDHIHIVSVDDLSYLSLMTQEVWERTVSEASALLCSEAGQGWHEDYARSLVHRLLPDTAKEFNDLLWNKSSRLCHFSITPDGSRILTSYGRGADQLVEAVLAESETPLHVTEIARRAKNRDGKIST
ncbi:MAG: sigma factor-like helix-turn-helix DNA-binding protein [Pseudomonadota bacterium]